MPPPPGSQIDKSTPSDWRQKGFKFSEIPPHIQGLARTELRIPTDITTIIPDVQISVLDFIVAKLPPVCEKVESYNAPSTHSFFSEEDVSVDYLDLFQVIHVPPKSILIGLISKATQAWTDGSNSIKVPESDGRLPLWAPQIWLQIHQIVVPAQNDWKAALTWLQRDEMQQFNDQIRSVLQSLSTLSWNGSLAPSSPGRNSFPKSTLLAYMSRNWTSDDNVDQMIHLLEHETAGMKNGSNYHFMDTILIRGILQAYEKEKAGSEIYCPNPETPKFLSTFGSKLNENSRLGGIFHVNNNHWVAIAIDVASQELLYGDPAESSSDSTITSALRWFLSKHLPSFPLDQLDEEILPCSKQNFSKDWFNCAFFSYNALLHHFIPSQPLLQHTDNPIFTDLARLDVLKKLISVHTKLNPADLASSTNFLDRFPDIVSNPRPSTPPMHKPLTEKRDLSSPHKPKAKRTKASSTTGLRSVVAPIFQTKTLGPKAQEYHDKPEEEKQEFFFSKVKQDPDYTEPTTSERRERARTGTGNPDGRPRLDILDRLTIEMQSAPGRPRKYRCAGRGCKTKWQPRSQARVLAHAKTCLMLTAEYRALASAASAGQAPGALVEALSATSITDTTPSSPSPQTPHSPNSKTKMSIRPLLPRSDSSFFGPTSRKAHHQQIDLAIIKLICAARIPPAIADLDEWKFLHALQTPSYSPASRTKLMDSHIMSEQEHVRQRQFAEMQAEKRVSISFDGGSIRSGEMFYTVNGTTGGPIRKVRLLEGQDCTGVSHTGEWIANLVFRVIDLIGLHRIVSVSADNTGNTRVAREIICDRIPTILNLPDPEHHLNNTWKDVAGLEFFRSTVKSVRGVIKYFKDSKHSKALLKDTRARLGTGPGLESVGKTRFATLVWAALSVKRSLPAIRDLCLTGQVVIPKYNNLFTQQMETLQFELRLTQFVSVGEGFARAIECLEATATTPADVYLYWLAVVAHLKDTLETNALPGQVCDEIRGIVVSRWREFFVDGPTNVHLSAFYLNPSYVRSSIFKNPNPLSFSITLPGKEAPSVPPGIKNPKTFLEVGRYLHGLLVIEVNQGADPFLTCWKDRPQAFTKLYQAQFTAYAQGSYPFTTPLSLDQSPLEWWMAYEGTPNAGILAAIAIKLYSSTPHSMADERTMSSITMINSAQRNRQKVNTVMAMAQIGGYYKVQKPSKVRKSAHPSPVIKFFDIHRVLRSIDDDSDERYASVTNYDESDDDEDHDTNKDKDATGQEPSEPIPTSSVLPVSEDDEDIDLASEELREILSDKPIARKEAEDKTHPNLSYPEEKEEDGTFELLSWV